jgi:hypothetical protein
MEHETTSSVVKVIMSLGFGEAVKRHHLGVSHKKEEACHLRYRLRSRDMRVGGDLADQVLPKAKGIKSRPIS